MRRNGEIVNFSEFSKFQSIEEFNTHIRQWLDFSGSVFTKGELIGLTRLVRYCVKVVGVANMKIGTILRTIHEEFDGNGISRSTFKRMIGKAKGIGMLTVMELSREKGGQSSNLYIFHPCPENIETSRSQKGPPPEKAFKATTQQKTSPPSSVSEPPSREQLNHHKTNKNLKTKTKNKITNRTGGLDYTFTGDFVPKPFTLLVKSFFDSAATIEEYWRMARLAAQREPVEAGTETVLETAILSFKQTIRAVKQGRVRNAIAYFYGIARKKFWSLHYIEDKAKGRFCSDPPEGHWITRKAESA
ncbi:hypothetical protein MM300_07370 [Evansella sp. LMS18]|uniref:hypothetical protein n=1 Tax=Evansella sp. LMS18 TaxID=2924033 RepID=UPI0020D1E83D|nr:hypothetical protein [Evansella sp. LMS18]UTR12102.1 hypothetical protein MM300_07370 [Evansella sp. LMS18]